MPQFYEDNDPRQSKPITLRSGSRSQPLVSILLDPLQLKVLVMPLDWVASEYVQLKVVIQMVFMLGSNSVRRNDYTRSLALLSLETSLSSRWIGP